MPLSLSKVLAAAKLVQLWPDQALYLGTNGKLTVGNPVVGPEESLPLAVWDVEPDWDENAAEIPRWAAEYGVAVTA